MFPLTRVRHALVPLLIPALAICAVCASERDMSDSGSTGLGTATDGSSSGDSGASGTSSGELFDVGDGMGTAGDGDGDKGCHGVDFLFVVDNSGSMADEQENLAASFPGFVQAIEEKVAEFEAADFHILVADTDAIRIESPGAYCSFTCDGMTDFCDAESGADVPCEFYSDAGCFATCQADINASCPSGNSCLELMGCDPEGCGCGRGEGLVNDKAETPCGVQGDQRYIVSGQPDLAGTFACLAEVGAEGDGDEHQAQGIVRALSPELLAQDGCNGGFIRDDAILVVTLITDEEDALQGAGSPGDPADWMADVVAAKNGDAEAVVMLGLIGDGGQPNPVCPDAGNETGMFAPRLDDFITSFPRHVKGSVCEPNYASFFEQAVDIIKTTCEVYVPPQG